MELQNNLDTIGTLQINPLAELLAEIAQNQLNGSLRIGNAAQKTAVYFDAGEVVFAVSNARQHRLFETLIESGAIPREQLTAITDFTNDLALKENLLAGKILLKEEIERLFPRQISKILRAALAWQTGEWTFSPLVRIKGDVRHRVDWRNLLVEHARELPAEEIARKFNNPQERLSPKSAFPADVNLSPPESFVFSRFETESLTIEAVQTLSGLPEAETRRILYALWLGGLIVRENWSAAFSERKVAAILSARLSLKKDAVPEVAQPPKAKVEPLSVEAKTIESVQESAPTEGQISLDEYLARVEQAANFYEIFALPPKAAASEIKQTYFALAKRFHPDLFYKETDAKLLQRVQHAFTELAHAYDTLRTESSREVYDFKMRKELAEVEFMRETEATPEAVNLQKQVEQAAESFEQGFGLLMDEKNETAVVHLARAVHFAKDNARYRAYYGKALAANDKKRHQAEAELQAAVRLDGQNADYRIMLAEFFLQVGLRKRAEGELNRLLTIFPDHREAKTLLDSLAKK
jgi:tetratricopeptide (TPR) repeat protein